MTLRIVAAHAIGGALRLQSLAEQVFGAQHRDAQWFARKLHRELVDDTLSMVAVDGDDLDDPRAWLGYVLVGRPPSCAPAARTAGTAVIAPARGRGVATALLEAAARTCADAGLRSLQLWAEQARESFYCARGFELQMRFSTMLAFARGPAAPWPGPLPWRPPDEPALQLLPHGFLPEAWERTPAHERATWSLTSPLARVHVAREARAFAVHGVWLADLRDAARVLDAVLTRLPTDAPVVAVALAEPDASPAHATASSSEQEDAAAVSSITAPTVARLRRLGWLDAQRGAILQRRL
ncbi:MAG: GNAT family N-acetyltransferase [Nannocystaceae bacterium]|nr:GNAT family N-acetyltransferase [Nannocystaceae bacterium]